MSADAPPLPLFAIINRTLYRHEALLLALPADGQPRVARMLVLNQPAFSDCDVLSRPWGKYEIEGSPPFPITQFLDVSMPEAGWLARMMIHGSRARSVYGVDRWRLAG